MKLRLLVCSFISLVLLASCTPNEEDNSSLQSNSNNEIPTLLQINWVDTFKQEEDDYLVFFHSDTCSHCQEIMGDVIAFANSNIKKTYFANIESPEGKMPIAKGSEPLLGIDNISDFYIPGTPTLIEIKEGVVTANNPGKDKCLTFLNQERLNKN